MLNSIFFFLSYYWTWIHTYTYTHNRWLQFVAVQRTLLSQTQWVGIWMCFSFLLRLCEQRTLDHLRIVAYNCVCVYIYISVCMRVVSKKEEEENVWLSIMNLAYVLTVSGYTNDNNLSEFVSWIYGMPIWARVRQYHTITIQHKAR